MRHVLVLVILLAASQAWAQLFSKPERENFIVAAGDVGWAEGTVLFDDGTEEKGQLRYNSRTGVVSFESVSRSRSYHARNLAGFAFKDGQRQFYSIPYRSKNGDVRQFFELVREYKDFAVISRTSMLSQNTSSELTTLYFLRASDRSVMPYLEVLDREVKLRIFEANKIQVRVLDPSLPEVIMGDNFAKVQTFAKERKLVWHVTDSLLSILDYYDSLLR